jgi:hypothetical protein
VLAQAKDMNLTVLKAPVALAPAGILFSGSLFLFFRERILGSFLQLLGLQDVW